MKSFQNNKNKKQKRRHLEHWHIISIMLTVYDTVAVNFAYIFALWIRFDGKYSKIPLQYLEAYLKFAPIYTLCALVVFRILRLYKSIWRFASFSELSRILISSIITAILHIAGITALFGRMPLSYYFIGTMVQFMLVVGVRFSYRFILLEKKKRSKKEQNGYMHRVMVIGAGAAGQVIVRDIEKTQELTAKVCCIIDDNPNKWNRYIDGVCVVGGREDILSNVEKYHINRIMFAIAKIDAESKRDILNICKESGCELKVIPAIYQLVNGEVSLSKMKNVDVEDLLGREPIIADTEKLGGYIKGKSVLVTGGGGSIGSELCRQIAGAEPSHLIIFEIYENNAYDIEQELKKAYPDLRLTVLIGSVRDSRRINGVFEKYKPDIVYHAAAHKHVPLMEGSPCEAIKNNVIGTYKTAYAALINGCRRFVLISTDKAVNPTNIMGASKRLCEMVIQSMNRISKSGNLDMLPKLYTHACQDDETISCETMSNATDNVVPLTGERNGAFSTEFVAVRFGNVLGSNGSVIPLFRKQIEQGGPVTVTHPDIIRYFMTIPEAVGLVLEAGCYAKGGEIFVLDMGEPVKIDTLARNLIKLSGYKPDKDIKVIYTGLRPGEKLYEEKLMLEEGLETTPNKLIHIGKPIPFDIEKFLGQMEYLTEACYSNREDIVKIVMEMVSTFRPIDNTASVEAASTAEKAC